jgi:TP901 family phage tail tape measure protein
MAGTHAEELNFIASLTDQFTGPAGKVLSQFDKLTNKAAGGFRKARDGATGVAAAGLLMFGALQPAVAMERQLGEVKSLGVMDSSLQQLKQTSLEFSMEFGGNANEFVASAYDIQSSIAGLNSAELSGFTNQSNILAKATKSDAGTITDYVGTMFGIFENNALQMGKGEWIDQLTGKTAAAVQMFKTTGSEMAGAFGSLGAQGQSLGINLSEQIAVMGQLQSTMSGSEAGTKYKAFLAGVGKAQESLGLSFTDSQGKMLPMLDILDAIKGKFGDTLTVAESDALSKAFGGGEALGVITQLMGGTDALAGNIKTLRNQSDNTKAVLMAQAQVDPWQRAKAGIDALRISIGSTLLPVINPLINGFTKITQKLQRWSQMFPNITKFIGFISLAVLGMAGVMGMLTIVSGLATAAGAGFTLMMAFMGAVFAILTSPIGLLIAGFGLLVWFWDDLKSSFGDTDWFKTIEGVLVGLMAVVNKVIDGFKELYSFDFSSLSLDGIKGFVLDSVGLGDAEPKKVVNSYGSVSDDDAPDISAFLNGPTIVEFNKRNKESLFSNRGQTIEKVEINTSQPVNGSSLEGLIGMGA